MNYLLPLALMLFAMPAAHAGNFLILIGIGPGGGTPELDPVVMSGLVSGVTGMYALYRIKASRKSSS